MPRPGFTIAPLFFAAVPLFSWVGCGARTDLDSRCPLLEARQDAGCPLHSTPLDDGGCWDCRCAADEYCCYSDPGTFIKVANVCRPQSWCPTRVFPSGTIVCPRPRLGRP